MASYPPPNPQQGSIFNPSDWIVPNTGSIDTAYLNEHYCQFPVAQGNMSFAGISNTGSTTIKQNLVMTGTANTNYIEFPDGTKQYTAVAGNDILKTPNTWIGVNTFYPNPVQTYGAPMVEGITITNNQIDDKDNDIVSYSPNSTQGLCMYSLGVYNNTIGKTPQIQLLPDGKGSIIQAQGSSGYVSLIATGVGGVINLNSTGGIKLNTTSLINFNNYSTLSATSPSSGIISSAKFSAPYVYSSQIVFTDVSGVATASTIYSNSSANIDMVCSQLNLAGLSVGTTVSITPQAGNLDVGTTITVPTQSAYDSGATYENVLSTQAFVQSAINSQGSGDVSLAGTNAFTGVNTFSNFCGATSFQSFPLPSSAQFATLNYVNNLQSVSSSLDFFLEIGFGGTPNDFNIPTLIIANKIVQIFNYTINTTTSSSSSNIISWEIVDTILYGQQNLIVSVYIASTLQTFTCPITYWVYSGGSTNAEATSPINLAGLGTISITFNGYLTY
jgi:hypothetical protein